MPPKDFIDNPFDEMSCSSCETATTPKKKQQQPKKSVHFNESCVLKLYPMPTREDRVNAWYNGNELKSFKQGARVVARAVRHGKTVDGEEMVFGLDSVQRQRSDLKVQRRFLLWDIVFESQWKNASDLEIAERCASVSVESSRDAQQVATLLQLSMIRDFDIVKPKKTTATPVVRGHHTAAVRAA